MTVAELAQAAYEAYGTYTEWHNYQGRPMPRWENLGARIQGAWMAAVYRVTQECGVVIDAPPEEAP